MQFEDLIREAYKENSEENLHLGFFVTWLLKKGKISDFISTIEADPIKKVSIGKRLVTRLEHSDDMTQITSLIGGMGYIEESEKIFEALLARTPDDPVILNSYGYVILNHLIESQKRYPKAKIQTAQNKISKAASIDKCLYEKSLVIPSYKNLCFLRLIEAEYYNQIGAHLPAFLMAWMSVEMSIYRIFYSQLQEKRYSRSKINELLGKWDIYTIIELLCLEKCDPLFVKSKKELDLLRSLRNHLIHGYVLMFQKKMSNVALILLMDLR